jgi:hypothetical protein
MANTDGAFGFRPVRYLSGNPWNGAFNWYYIPATDGTATFIGDAVKSAGSGDTLGIYPTVAQAAATNAIRGVVIGFADQPYMAFDRTNLSRKYRPASTAMYAAVIDDPNVIFEIQEDSDGGALAATEINNNMDIVVGTGNTTTGISAMELDSSDAKTATAQIRVLGLAPWVEGNEIGEYAKWLVLINEHELKSTTGS